MNPPYGIVTIVGVGLLGGSLGLALKQGGLARVVRGVGRKEASLDKAHSRGAIDDTYLDLASAVKDADLVVLCTPAAQVPAQMDTIRDVISPNTLVTDVASTKAVICRHAAATWPTPLRFVGSHPMAGSEKYGPEHASADLYRGAVTILADGPEVEPQARDAIRRLWEAVGSQVVCMDAGIHDALVACSSHVPHIAAACLAELVANTDCHRAAIGAGFRDVTRVAEGRPELWRDICLTNAEAIAAGLDALGARIAEVRRMIESGAEDELTAFFQSGVDARRKALGE